MRTPRRGTGRSRGRLAGANPPVTRRPAAPGRTAKIEDRSGHQRRSSGDSADSRDRRGSRDGEALPLRRQTPPSRGAGRSHGDTSPSGLAFGNLLTAELRHRGLAPTDPRSPEPLATLDYAVERTIKMATLDAFWKAHGLPGAPEPLLPAPLPRGYRTTTKRKVLLRRDGLAFVFPGVQVWGSSVAPSALDAPSHLEVYRYLHEHVGHPTSEALAETLNWIVIRGAAPDLSVILNVRLFDGDVVRVAKRIAERLVAASLGVRSASLYLDPSGSDYYLDADRPAGVLSRKRLVGPDWMELGVAGVRLRFPPTVFSQVNQAMVGTMVETAGSLLGPLEGRRLVDLYCGYGLFSLTLGRTARSVVGLDAAGPAIEAASENARHTQAPGRFRFVAVHLTAEAIASRLPAPGREAEVLLLDPPRQGTGEGVVAALAQRRPERVLHICCGTDELPREIRAWTESGYRTDRIVPLDLFPGTTGIETLVCLVP